MPTARFRDAVVYEHGKNAGAHVNVDADAGWEPIPILPDCEHVPSTGVIAGSLTLVGNRCRSRHIANVCQAPALPPVSPILVGRRCRPRQIPYAYQAPALPPAPLALTGRRCRSRQTTNACLVSAVTPATLSLCDFTLTMVFWSRCLFFKTGGRCDLPKSPSRGIISLARPPRSAEPPPVGSALDLRVEYTFAGTRMGS